MSNVEQNYEEFISTVSHELRTPLTSIRGFSQTMLNSWDKLNDEDKKKFIKIIENQSNRLINLVENMLSVTKLQSGRDNLVFREVNVKSAVEPVISLIKNQYPDCEIKLDINPCTPSIYADKDKFQQVMTNLIENAAKYSDSSSAVTVKSGWCECCEFVSIKVINKGIEINKEDYEKIFTKFSRLDNPLTRKTQGSGLGLYITKNLTEKMHGKISVNSVQNVTTFEVMFPVCNPEEQARAKCSQ